MQRLSGTRNGGSMNNTWRRACAACTKAKRQCTKSTPSCRRCSEKGVRCIYPPARSPEPHIAGANRAEWPEMITAELPEGGGTQAVADLAQLGTAAAGTGAQIATPPSMRIGQPSSEQAAVSGQLWFLDHHSWEVRHLAPNQVPEAFGGETLEAYVAAVQTWLREWVTEDHSALFHRYLYCVRMPRCTQDAYGALAAYLGRTPATAATVRRLVEDRLNQLVQDSAIEAALDLGASAPIDHVARVQALLIYQVICLFDGNIRLRARAELHLPALLSWSEQMLERITDEVKMGEPLSLMPAGGTDASLGTWTAWIFLESVRRTWLTCGILHGVYMTMREGYSACPGGLHCTFGKGLWDAKSAHQWRKKALQEDDTLFMQSLNVGDLFSIAEPDGVDDFGHAVMLVSFGLHRMESWKAGE